MKRDYCDACGLVQSESFHAVLCQDCHKRYKLCRYDHRHVKRCECGGELIGWYRQVEVTG